MDSMQNFNVSKFRFFCKLTNVQIAQCFPSDDITMWHSTVWNVQCGIIYIYFKETEHTAQYSVYPVVC